MRRLRQIILCLIAAAPLSILAQNTVPGPVRASLKHSSTVLPVQSPVSFFRKLLAMSPVERTNCLANRSAEARAHILAKVAEYEQLSPDDRELRLRATDLRWWLTPMLRMSPTNRMARLAQVPEELRPLVQSRLEQWSILPPPLQQEFLANDQALHYFARIEDPSQPVGTAQQQKIARQFNHFFELTEQEKDQTLNLLSEDERVKMEDTLKTFEHLPPQQRELCVRNYARFAGMSADERAEFLKNAERWSKMTPGERQSWRELVQQVPIWPAGWTPNQPTPLQPAVSGPRVATNSN